MLAEVQSVSGEIEEYPVDQIGGENSRILQKKKTEKNRVLKDAKFSYISSESDQKDTRRWCWNISILRFQKAFMSLWQDHQAAVKVRY